MALLRWLSPASRPRLNCLPLRKIGKSRWSPGVIPDRALNLAKSTFTRYQSGQRRNGSNPARTRQLVPRGGCYVCRSFLKAQSVVRLTWRRHSLITVAATGERSGPLW